MRSPRPGASSGAASGVSCSVSGEPVTPPTRPSQHRRTDPPPGGARVADTILSGSDLDLVELALTAGGLDLLPAEDAVLTDAERTPVARLAADGTLTPLRPL